MMNRDQLGDTELWQAVVSDDASAFTTLYHRYWKKVYKTVNYYIRDAGQSEIILADVFIVLWERRKTLVIENFSSYITVTARYHVFKHFKKLQINPIEYIEAYTDDMFLTEHVSNTEKLVASKDFEVQLEQALADLPKKCREIFWESRVKNLSNDEIAASMNISKRTVENQITAALKHLRKNYGGFAYLIILCALGLD